SVPSSEKGKPAKLYTCPVVSADTAAAILGKLFQNFKQPGQAQSDVEIPARINVNKAPREVLMAIPGMTEADADTIVNTQGRDTSSDAKFATPAWLIGAGVKLDTLASIEKYITTRSQVYRVHIIGGVGDDGPVARFEAVIDANGGRPRIMYFRDLTEAGGAIR